MKQVLVIRKDLKMRKGKTASQAAHAAMKAVYYWENGIPKFYDHPYIYEWLRDSFTKVTVSVNSEAELKDIYEQVCLSGLPHSIIEDEGRTEFHGEHTFTAVAVGPGPIDEVDAITGELPLL